MQVSEIDNMPFYELEYTAEYYQEIIEERNKEQEKQQKDQEGKYNIDSYRKTANNIQRYKPAMTPGNFKIPSFPKF